MAYSRRVVFLVLTGWLVFGALAGFPRNGGAAAERRPVMGIVERVDGYLIAVGGKVYDLKGASIKSTERSQPVEISVLRGQTVELVFRNGKVESVTVYRTLPQ
jgi:hypothetical protein